MSQNKVLLDTNAYLRLAQNIRPLLFVEFGGKKHCLYVIDEFENEFSRSSRLKNKFEWVNDAEYKENRKYKLTVSNKEKKEIEIAEDVIDNLYKELTISPVDIKALAIAYVKEIKLITDDTDMHVVATELEVDCIGTLKLLKLMLDNNHISLEKVIEIAEHWNYIKDLPLGYKKFKEEFKQLFGKDIEL